MKYLVKQPLLHFLLIGFALFALFELTSAGDPAETDPKTVVVDRETLLQFMQFRSKAFDRKRFEKELDRMPEEQRRRLEEDFIREEVLHREALALGLDREDYVIRRRLVQKLDFITQGFANAALELSREDVVRYFEEHRDDYYVQPHVTFTHVFLDTEKHGQQKALELAQAKLAELRENGAGFTEAPSHGDRFLYHVNYVERVPEFVASHFGPEMARAVFEMEPDDAAWHGPLPSPYGYHLVMLTARRGGRTPEVDEIYGRVEQDTRHGRVRVTKEKAIQEIIKTYDVQVVRGDAETPGSKEGAAAPSGVERDGPSEAMASGEKSP